MAAEIRSTPACCSPGTGNVDAAVPSCPGGEGSLEATFVDVGHGLGPRGHLFALDASNGSPLWAVDLIDDHGAKKPHYGFTTSPVLADGKFEYTPRSDAESGGESG